MNPGGYVSGGALVALDDDECILNRDGLCIREDVRHHRLVSEVRTWGKAEPVGWATGPCQHRPCHVVEVESLIDGKILAHLCRACDAQLP